MGVKPVSIYAIKEDISTPTVSDGLGEEKHRMLRKPYKIQQEYGSEKLVQPPVGLAYRK